MGIPDNEEKVRDKRFLSKYEFGNGIQKCNAVNYGIFIIGNSLGENVRIFSMRNWTEMVFVIIYWRIIDLHSIYFSHTKGKLFYHNGQLIAVCGFIK